MRALAQEGAVELLQEHGVEVYLKDDDNKPRKLKYNLGHPRVLAFGGAYSNLIRALARSGHEHGYETIGVIRGEEHLPLNPSLSLARSYGMRLTYLDRAAYRAKHTPAVQDQLRRRFGDVFILPEGASNAAAVRGCAELPGEIEGDYDVVCCPVGTGGTLAGIAAGLPPGKRAIGFAVLKGGAFLDAEVARLQTEAYGAPTANWSIELGYHFGGYARTNATLESFLPGFEKVYVAKMLYGILDLVRQGRFAPGTRVVAVVTAQPDTPVEVLGSPTGLDSGDPRCRR